MLVGSVVDVGIVVVGSVVDGIVVDGTVVVGPPGIEAKVAAGSVSWMVSGGPGRTTPGLQPKRTVNNPPMVAVILRPATVVDCGVTVSSRNSMAAKVEPTVQVMSS